MKKVALAGICAASFLLGAGSLFGEGAGLRLDAKFVSEAPASLDLDSEIWNEASAVEIPLVPQVTLFPWGGATDRRLGVRALHDGEKIYFRLEWKDETENRESSNPAEFPDACAVMFPLAEPKPESLMMGFLGPVYLWHWKGDWDKEARAGESPRERSAFFYSDFHIPFEKGTILDRGPQEDSLSRPVVRKPVEELIAAGAGTLRRSELQETEGRGLWSDGRWAVTFSRPMPIEVKEARILREGQEMKIAFAVWDGAREERGARKSISDWMTFALESRKG